MPYPRGPSPSAYAKCAGDRNLNQADFAKLIGASAHAYEAWETGRNKPADMVGLAEKLERVTGVPRQWFLGWMDSETPKPSGPEGQTLPPAGLEPATLRLFAFAGQSLTECGRMNDNQDFSRWLERYGDDYETALEMESAYLAYLKERAVARSFFDD